MNYQKEYFEPTKRAEDAKNIEEINNILDNCIDTLLWEIERQPTPEKSQQKFDAIFLDLMEFWIESRIKGDIYWGGNRQKIGVLVLGICSKCKKENLYLSNEILYKYFIQGIFIDEIIKETCKCDTDEDAMRVKQDILLSEILPPMPQIEQPQKYEWQKLDPMPIMPEDLCNTEKRQTLDFARAVFYYAEQGHFLKLENGQYKEDNISQTLLGYMCAFILYYGTNTEMDIIKAPLPKPDFFSIYFYGKEKEGILRKARNEMQYDLPQKIRQGKKIVPPHAEKIDEIIQKAAKEVGIEKRVI